MTVEHDLAEREGNIFARRLAGLAPLCARDRVALVGLLGEDRSVGPGHELVFEGSRPSSPWMLAEGMACRVKDHGGRRQIIALMLPGDTYGVHAADQRTLDHDIRTLSRCRIVGVDPSKLEALALVAPTVADALRCDERVQEAILRTWLFNLGQMTALERLAHLLCELAYRLGELGLLYRTGAFRLPVSQEAMGAVIGVTRVQAGRALQRLRSDGLIDLHGGVVLVLDLARLAELAQFDPTYLRP
jgi:CRP-like cAMP-binding protein